MRNKYQLGQKIRYQTPEKQGVGHIVQIKLSTIRGTYEDDFASIIDPKAKPSYRLVGGLNFFLENEIKEVINDQLK